MVIKNVAFDEFLLSHIFVNLLKEWLNYDYSSQLSKLADRKCDNLFLAMYFKYSRKIFENSSFGV